MLKYFMAILMVMLLAGCSDGCKTGDTKCSGDAVYICNSSDNWELSADCGDIEDFGLGIDWTCCVDPEDGLYSCLPADECNGDPDAGDGGD